MNYKTISNLNFDIKKWVSQLPKDIDLVVGIPRSGLLPANLLALYKNLPLTDIEGLINNRIFNSGLRLKNNEDLLNSNKRLKILIVDDSVSSGRQINKIKQKVKNATLPFDIFYAAVYATPIGTKFVDFWYEIINQPRCFEWNIMHSDILKLSCVDIDGVLCIDPLESENDDDTKYKNFVQNARSLIIPSVEIGWLVTCRLEKYRTLTEQWLANHNVKYRHLVMMNLPDKQSRIILNNHAEYKANIYTSTKANFFIESSYEQAIKIAKISGKEVYCFETNEIIKPNKFQNILSKTKENINITKNPFHLIYKVKSYIIHKNINYFWKIKSVIKKRRLIGSNK